jgi:hypothetical protein
MTGPVKLSGPTDIAAIVPALLGFVPENSLLAVILRGSTVYAVARADLTTREAAPLAAFSAGQGLIGSVGAGADGVVFIAVGRDEATRMAALAESVRVADRHGVLLHQALAIPSLTAGEPVVDVNGVDLGAIPSLSAEVTAVFAAEGQTIHGSRTDLEPALDPDGPTLDTAKDPEWSDAEAIRALKSLVEQTHAGEAASDDALAAAAAVLRRLPVRDMAIGFAGTDLGSDAADVWAMLIRRTTGPIRAEAATLYAITNYIQGRCIAAGAGLDVALEVDPSHVLARYLHRAFGQGFTPESLAVIADANRGSAARLGVQIL